MDGKRGWRHLASWHELVEARCLERGYFDNLELAEKLCTLSGNQSEAAFEAALRSLRNWRSGKNVPQRRNFIYLTTLLDVAADDALLQRWRELYVKARTGDPGQPAQRRAATILGPARRPRASVVIGLAGAGAMLAVAATIAVMILTPSTGQTPGFEGIEASYVRHVTARVGDSLVVHGARADDCGDDAPSWAEAVPHLPNLRTGTLLDGGVGTRFSRQCGGRTPARAILFTATRPGLEEFSLYGDLITINVQ